MKGIEYKLIIKQTIKGAAYDAEPEFKPILSATQV
jgi:hypothetical protein